MRLTPGSRWRRLMWLKSAHVEEELSQQSPDLNMTRPRVSRVPLDVYGCIIDSVEDNDWPDLVAFSQTCKVFWTACNALKVWRPLCLRLGYGLPTEPLRGSCFKQDWRALAAGLAKAKAVGWKSLDLHVQPKEGGGAMKVHAVSVLSAWHIERSWGTAHTAMSLLRRHTQIDGITVYTDDRAANQPVYVLTSLGACLWNDTPPLLQYALVRPRETSSIASRRESLQTSKDNLPFVIMMEHLDLSISFAAAFS